MTELRTTSGTRRAAPSEDASDLTFFGILATILRRRLLVLGLFAVTVIASLAFLLWKPRTYTTVFSFIPESGQDGGKAGLAGLAGQFGVTLAGAGAQPQSPQMYADLLQTREILDPIAKDAYPVGGVSRAPAPLADVLEAQDATPALTLEKTVRRLRERVISATVATRTTGVVTVRVKTQSPQLSQALAERLLSGLNQFNLVTRQSQAAAERRFIEKRLEVARGAQRGAEQQLERFLENNRQFGNSPELSFRRDRLQAELSMQQQVVTTLAQQYEETRIKEVRDLPVVTVIEKPLMAARPDPRGGLFILGGGIVVGLFLGVAAALLREEYDRARRTEAPSALGELQDVWQQARRAHP